MVNKNVHEIPKSGKMKVPGVVFASEKLFEKIKNDKTIEQVRNVAMLPGIVEKSIAMPDAHQGYGFCVGGVAAFDLEKGIISPGGIGYDINCGVRLLRTGISKKDFLKKREEILNELYKKIPSGVGEAGEFKFDEKEMKEILEQGCEWAVTKGFATKEDLERIEDGGKISGASALKISQRARARGRNQLGTIGAGNHFLEVQFVEQIFDAKSAKVFGLEKDEVVVMMHTGSRGLGHQVCSDYILRMEKEFGTENLPDRELACAPLSSEAAKDYLAAMRAAANFAFVNRQLITYQVRNIFKKFFPDKNGKGARKLLADSRSAPSARNSDDSLRSSSRAVEIVYDVAHNIAKFEEFEIGGKKKTLCVHRKGATRSFGIGRKELPKIYRKTGQPVLIPGSMGTASYVLAGTSTAEKISFASTAHGAGRLLSRSFAKNNLNLASVKKNLKSQDILLKTGSEKGILEEAPEAYKDVDEVVRVSDELGIGKIVARLKPIAVVKG